MRIRANKRVTTALLAIGVAVGGSGVAAAQPGDYSTLPVDPNVVTDSTAYTSTVPVLDPNGQPGVTVVYTHRDGLRHITNTILMVSDPAAINAQNNLTNRVTNGKTQPVAAGTDGTVITGSSSDGAQSVSVLQFTEGKAVATVEFAGPTSDPVPIEFVTEYGQQQDAAIKAFLQA